MRDSKKGVLVLGLTVAALCAPVNSSFAQQAHTPMSGPPQPPKTTTTPTGTWLPKSIAYIKASNTGKDNQFGYAIALSADGNTLAVGATFRGQRRQRRQRRFQGPCGKFRRGVRLYSRQQGLEAAGLP